MSEPKTDPRELYVTFDGDTHWLEHFIDDDGTDEACDGSPVCTVEPGTRLSDLILKAEQHTCEGRPS